MMARRHWNFWRISMEKPLNFSLKKFTTGGTISDAGKNYILVKTAFMEKFGKVCEAS